MVIIHPTVTHDRASLAALQIATGMRVTLGQCYLRLSMQTAACQRQNPHHANPSPTAPTGTAGGDAA